MSGSDDITAGIGNLHRWKAGAEADGVRRVNEAMLVVQRAGKLLCPVDEGALRADISVAVQPTADGVIGSLYNTLDYAPFVHQGTGVYAVDGDGRKEPWVWVSADGSKAAHTIGQRSQPYLEQAFIGNLVTITRIMGRPA